jgi:hypothetical protein
VNFRAILTEIRTSGAQEVPRGVEETPRPSKSNNTA